MKTSKRRQGIRMVCRLSIMLFALVMTAVSFAYSWFYYNKNADVSDLEMNVEEAYNLLVRSGDGEWTKHLSMNFPQDFALNAVAGNGVNFFTPERELQKLGEGEGFDRYGYVTTGYTPLASDAWEAAGIFTFDFSFRIEGECNLYLSELSLVEPSDRAPASDYDADISTGAVVGAVRVAFLQEVDGAFLPVALWAPDVTTALTEENGQYTVTSGTPESFLVVSADADGNAAVTEISVEGTAAGSKPMNGVTYAWGAVSAADLRLRLGHLRENAENRFRLVIWLDGNDRECANALLSGIVTLRLSFAADDVSESN